MAWLKRLCEPETRAGMGGPEVRPIGTARTCLPLRKTPPPAVKILQGCQGPGAAVDVLEALERGKGHLRDPTKG